MKEEVCSEIVNKYMNHLSISQRALAPLLSCKKKLSFANVKQEIDSDSNHLESLSDLNDDCLLHVMSFLGLVDTFNLGITCRRMQPVAQRSLRRFHHFSFGNSFLDEPVLDLILQEMGNNLKSVEIFRLDKRMLDKLLKCCFKLKYLKLVNPCNIFNSMSFTAYKSIFKNVVNLEIRKGGFFFSTLRRAKRHHNFDKLLIALTESDTLTSLKIEYIEVSQETFHHLKSLRNLKCLHLERCIEIGFALPFYPHFQHLTELIYKLDDSRTHELVLSFYAKDAKGILRH